MVSIKKYSDRFRGTGSVSFLFFTACFSINVFAQVEPEEESEALPLDRILVTGSRIKRSEAEGPAQVITITREDMDERGYTTVFEALSDLAINNGYRIEGSESPNGFSPDVQTLNLRSMGVGTTLTLLNGRRLANYPAAYQSESTVFSYASIPIAAVERIEILATGASAIYGSDAVAGVVNIILRSDINETVINALWGTPTETNSTRADLRLQLLTGKTFDRGTYTFTFEYHKREAVLGKHYDQYDDQQDDYPYGEGFYSRSLLTLDLVRSAFGVFPRYRDPADIFDSSGQDACNRSGTPLAYASRPGAGNFCANPGEGVAGTSFRNGRESYAGYFTGTFELDNKGTELWTDILLSSSESANEISSKGISEDVLDLTRPDSIGFGFFDWYWPRRSFTEQELGRNLDRKYEEDALTVVLGARGYLVDTHDWEFSISYSDHDYASAEPFFKWREVIDTFLGTHLGTSFFGDDWWSGGTLGENLAFPLGDPDVLYGEVNQAVRDAMGVSRYNNKSKDLFLNFTASGDLWDMKAGPMSYAVVAEYEELEINYRTDDLLRQLPPTTDSSGNQIPTALTGSGWWRLTGYSGTGTRERWSLGGELRLPVHDTLTLNIAARYDDYDSLSTSFGGDLTPSASIEWRPTDNFLARAGYTKSFRAPDMAAVYTETGFFTGGVDLISCYEQYVFTNGNEIGFDPSACLGSGFFVQRVGPQAISLPSLDAEKGHSAWVGFSWDILDNLSLTVDYTTLQLNGVVVSQSVSGLLGDEWACFIGNQPISTPCDQINQQIIRKDNPISGVSFVDEFFVTSVNQHQREGEYLDINVYYQLNTNVGDFRFDGQYSNMLSSRLQVSRDAEPLDLRNSPFYANGYRASFTGTVSWARDNFNTALTAIYKGGVPALRCGDFTNGCVSQVTGEDYIATGNYRMDSYLTWNFTAAYFWGQRLMTRLRVQNLFAQAPPRDDSLFPGDNPWYNFFAYPGAAIGRYAALEFEYTF